MPKAIRVYTKHGMRAHYARWNPDDPYDELYGHLTFCGKAAYPLVARSRFFRRRLAQTSVCGRCEKAEEAL